MTERAKIATNSRAALRDIQPASAASCRHCDQVLSFRARMRSQQVVCNVYEDGRWARLELFHPECYEEAGSPYGEPSTVLPNRHDIDLRTPKKRSEDPTSHRRLPARGA